MVFTQGLCNLLQQTVANCQDASVHAYCIFGCVLRHTINTCFRILSINCNKLCKLHVNTSRILADKCYCASAISYLKMLIAPVCHQIWNIAMSHWTLKAGIKYYLILSPGIKQSMFCKDVKFMSLILCIKIRRRIPMRCFGREMFSALMEYRANSAFIRKIVGPCCPLAGCDCMIVFCYVWDENRSQ